MSEVTLKKLSELSGLSVRTVNRALKNQGEVSAASRKLVMDLAEKYNYIPNVAARNFRLRKKNIVGILMCDRIVNASHLQKVADLESKLAAAHYCPLLGCVRGRDPRELLQEWIGTVDFVISFYPPDSAEHPALFEGYPYTFIVVDHNAGRTCHSITVDRSAGIAAAYQCLVERGCRKIVHCGSPRLRIGAVRGSMEKLRGRAEFVHVDSGIEFDDGFRIGAEIIRCGADAVFFDTDRMAAGFYRYAWENRLRIPEDISVVGFDDDPVSVMLSPPLSTVAHPVDAISRTVMEIISSAPGEVVRRVLPTRFIRRGSIR